MVVPRHWVSIKVTAQATDSTEKALYEQIRKGTFPFGYRRAGRKIWVSARDLGLIEEPQSNKAEPQDKTLPEAA
jgi:hypothetical protein